METGRVIFWNDVKGFGFIKDDKTYKETFFHQNESLYKGIAKGDLVEFDVKPSKNKPQNFICVNVKRIDK